MEKITSAELDQFTGTEQYYKYLAGLKLTDGVKFLADKGCYWIIDIIASYQYKHADKTFQVWKLTVDLEKHKGKITMAEDSEIPFLVTQNIPYTDFNLPELELWVESGVVLLPSEH